MYTGIIQHVITVEHIKGQTGLMDVTFVFPENALKGLELGASVSINGTCLTVTKIKKDLVTFQIMQETLGLTTLGNLQEGDKVNMERSLRFGDEVGGHMLSGHVHGQAKVVSRVTSENNLQLTLEVPDNLMPYILPKGFVGLHGASLTVGEVTDNQFNVHLIPETLARTNLGEQPDGAYLNLEVDQTTRTIVDTVKAYLKSA